MAPKISDILANATSRLGLALYVLDGKRQAKLSNKRAEKNRQFEEHMKTAYPNN
jgi:hypothetical protein